MESASSKTVASLMILVNITCTFFRVMKAMVWDGGDPEDIKGAKNKLGETKERIVQALRI